jgi:hypothetical protein
MIAGIAGSYIIVSCLSCSAPQEPPALQVQFESPRDAFSSLSEPTENELRFGIEGREAFRLPPRPQSPFSARNFAGGGALAQYRAQELATPLPLRNMQADSIGGQLSFGAPAAATGLGLDLQVSPHAHIETTGNGGRIARTGAELRVGQNLADLDQRGKSVAAPSWYFFVGQDNEALIWNVADNSRPSGVALRDQVTVGDLQAGVAMSTSRGGQMSLGLVERETSFHDAAGQNSISRRDRFAAFSFTLRR